MFVLALVFPLSVPLPTVLYICVLLFPYCCWLHHHHHHHHHSVPVSIGMILISFRVCVSFANINNLNVCVSLPLSGLILSIKSFPYLIKPSLPSCSSSHHHHPLWNQVSLPCVLSRIPPTSAYQITHSIQLSPLIIDNLCLPLSLSLFPPHSLALFT